IPSTNAVIAMALVGAGGAGAAIPGLMPGTSARHGGGAWKGVGSGSGRGGSEGVTIFRCF
ncbi:MAG TPA: hypothetical protein PLV85_26655, partial [Polyangiaceae bacterium]|nr:hypothetical protein [Polyangiaceae bacterium]